MLHKLRKLFQSCTVFGFKQTAWIVAFRAKRALFIHAMRTRSVCDLVGHSWNKIRNKHHTSWSLFWTQLLTQSLEYQDQLLDYDKGELVQRADAYAHHRFQTLGSDWYQLDDVMWHTDIRLKQQGGADVTFDSVTFYADIQIQIGETDALSKDIKVPWELSRLQHLPLLAQAYKRTRNQTYQDTFVYHVTHWHTHNPYLFGINWLCPMEVALRAISLVLAADAFKHTQVPTSFWQSYVSLLYDHIIYLEHNWEWYDGRTSNHYLSDLVGYLYLCYFFQSFNGMHTKIKWVIAQIVTEADKQVFDEGTSYEGSTKYHTLVTELLYHVQLLCAAMHIALPPSFHAKLNKMFLFLAWCTVNTKHMITVGDDDSGKVTFASSFSMNEAIAQCNTSGIKHYQQFGISFFKNDLWHISLRHHTYDVKQPSGHYHNDMASVTLAMHGIPVLVDPGSYVYTASRVWRNYFRSAQLHNVMSLEHCEPVHFDDRLFALKIPTHTCEVSHYDGHSLVSKNILYEHKGLKYHRDININENAVTITDFCESVNNAAEDSNLFFNLTFADHIVLQKEDTFWLGLYQDVPLFELYSSCELVQKQGYIAPAYGVLKPTTRLCATLPLLSRRLSGSSDSAGSARQEGIQKYELIFKRMIC